MAVDGQESGEKPGEVQQGEQGQSGAEDVANVADSSRDMQQQSKALDSITDHVEERQLDSRRVEQAMATIAKSAEEARRAQSARERELAAVKINAAQVDIIASELEERAQERSARGGGGAAEARRNGAQGAALTGSHDQAQNRVPGVHPLTQGGAEDPPPAVPVVQGDPAVRGVPAVPGLVPWGVLAAQNEGTCAVRDSDEPEEAGASRGGGIQSSTALALRTEGAERAPLGGAPGGGAGGAVNAKAKTAKPRRIVRRNPIPTSILENKELNRTIATCLPPNYDLEIHKTVWRVQQAKARTVALQFPEGLLMYATTIADILERFAGVGHCIILGDVTYGACCIDDISAGALGADLLVHYGHSCLVPISNTSTPCLYVFVGITIDVPHLCASLLRNFPESSHLAIAGTIQFSAAVQAAAAALRGAGRSATVPQSRPLSSGEVLGCTAPSLKRSAKGQRSARHGEREAVQASSRGEAASTAGTPGPPLGSPAQGGDGEGSSGSGDARQEARAWRECETAAHDEEPEALVFASSRGEAASTAGTPEALVFVSDGRFHLEAMMIANPTLPAFRYDPFTRDLLREEYDHAGMRRVRRAAVEAAREAKEWGVVLGTLGRQGNPSTLNYVSAQLLSAGRSLTVFLISELSPQKIAALSVQRGTPWVQSHEQGRDDGEDDAQGWAGVEQAGDASSYKDECLPEPKTPHGDRPAVPCIEAWVQIACPRLSIDWGEAFSVPVLTPYELAVCLGAAHPWWQSSTDPESSRDGKPVSEPRSGLDSQGAARSCSGCTQGTPGVAPECNSTGNECRTAAKDETDTVPRQSEGQLRLPSGSGVPEVYQMDYYAWDGGPWNSAHRPGNVRAA